MTATVEVPATAAPVATDVTFRIRRFLPEIDTEPHWEEYTLALFPTDRVLTALDRIKGERGESAERAAPSLAVRGGRNEVGRNKRSALRRSMCA